MGAEAKARAGPHGHMADRPQRQYYERLHLGLQVLQFPLQAARPGKGLCDDDRPVRAENRRDARSGGRPVAAAGRTASQARHRLLREPVPRAQEALSHAEAARSRRARGRPYRPHQLARRRNDAAPADGRRPRLAARSRSRDSRQRRAAGHIARKARRRPLAVGHAHGPSTRTAHLGHDDVRTRRDAAPARRAPDQDPQPAGRMPSRPVRIRRLHPVDFP